MKVKTYRPPRRYSPRYFWNMLVGRDRFEPKPDKIKLDAWDTWDVSSTVSSIIVKLLKQYKYKTHGYPVIFSEYYKEQWKSREEYDQAIRDGKIKGGGEKAWLDIIDKMIWSFEQVNKDDMEDGFHHGEIDFITVERGGKMYLENGPNHTHTFDREGYEAYMKEVQEGINLFAEYFLDIWD